jgi:tetratricopeptide (TPR) repeat protein
MVEEALEDGFVMAPYFAEALPVYEKQEAAMRLYFADLFENVNLRKEDKRLENVKFATTKRAGKLITAAQSRDPELTAAQKTLDEAERLVYNEKKYDKARDTYMRVLQQTEDRTVHARAYYGLGRVAALERNPELAEKLFHKTLELSPDPQTKAWAQLYLGRLSDLAGEREQAAKFYEAVLATEGASAAARKAAEEGLKSKFQKN